MSRPRNQAGSILDRSHLGGWHDNPEGVRACLARMPMPHFGAAAPDLMRAGPLDHDVLIYKALPEVLGDFPDYQAQEIGDCVSMGFGHGVDALACIEIAIGKESESFTVEDLACTEYLYAAARLEGNMLQADDGAYGAVGAIATTKWGTPSRGAIQTPYSGQRAKEWGRSGPPEQHRAEAAKHQVKTASRVTTLPELDAALENGYPVAVCSNQGFSLTRDAQGFCKAAGIWNHCMLILGVRVTGRKGYLICQSWGKNSPGGPLVLGMPSYSFWAVPQVVARMISQGDSFALSGFTGYPARPLPASWTWDAFK